MDSKPRYENQPVGVLGAGNFGTAISNLIAENRPVLLYSRNPDAVEKMIAGRIARGQQLHPDVTPTNDLAKVCTESTLLFPVIASNGFADLMNKMAPHLHPHHIIIHGTKGFDVSLAGLEDIFDTDEIQLKSIRTMTEVIREATVVVRIGVISGPNLAAEIAQGKPAAAVIASHFDEVVREAAEVLRSPRFRVYSSNDVMGVELAGVLKNIFALASGMLTGLEMGENARALLITRGLHEMVLLGRALGSDANSFFGLAGIGDLTATCSSEKSRNYRTGLRLSQGDSLKVVLADMDETVEGILTTRIAYALSKREKLDTPIIDSLYQVLYHNKPISQALDSLMIHRRERDIDF